MRAKCDSKTRKCLMLEHGEVTKGYRLYDITERKVIYSQDVKFNEELKDREQDFHDATDNDDYRFSLGLLQ